MRVVKVVMWSMQWCWDADCAVTCGCIQELQAQKEQFDCDAVRLRAQIQRLCATYRSFICVKHRSNSSAQGVLFHEGLEGAGLRGCATMSSDGTAVSGLADMKRALKAAESSMVLKAAWTMNVMLNRSCVRNE